jgi:hypothetical protein
MSRTIEEALAAAEAAGYRVDLLRRSPSDENISKEQVSGDDSVSQAAVAPEGTPATHPSLTEQPESAESES